ncbi:MAG TPA: sigma factor-like helix-turn-helix DNA-binding protein [Nocardioides sp.]|nr:sigma factor-like helix-turn-helix DNA-binding protein [Nocardioides sp.]
MAGNDADFDAYLAARWPFLVRSLVLSGFAPEQAEDVAVAGLARCRASWHSIREVDDVDAQVYGTVWDGRPHTHETPVATPVADPSEAQLLREQLEVQLGRLTVEEREAVVLRYVAGLDDVQVADVLDVPVGTVASRVAAGLARIEPAALRSEDVFRTAAASIDVATAPYDAVVDRVRRRRRRRWQVTAALTAAALLVVGAVTWASTRPDQTPAPPPTEVVPSQNPIDLAWYDGRLHLRQVTVGLPDVTALAGVGESVAAIGADGIVSIVSPAGKVEVVGLSTPGATILGSAENGWAAWVEPGDQGDRLVVWSIGLDEELGSLDVAPGTRLIAIDQDRVYAAVEAGTFSWPPTQDAVEPITEPGLLDVATATRVYQRGRSIEMVQPFFSVSFTRRGEGAMVSPGGNYVLTRAPGPWTPGTPYVPLVYDTRSGDRLPSGVRPDERVVDAAFGDNHDINYLVSKVGDLASVDLDGARSRLLVLRNCALEERTCHDVVPVRSTADRAMFAP